MFVRPRPKKSILPPPAKRRKISSAIEEINFDFDARADYLTGFHKRKVQRAKQAQEEAAKKAREERIVTRKQLREERRQELEEHVEAVNALLKEVSPSAANSVEDSANDDWNGIEDDQPLEPIDHEAEYIDEDRYTTVTVEAVDVSKEGLHKVVEEADLGDDINDDHPPGKREAVNSKGETTKKKIWPKKERKKKFRYESKAERRITRGKQKAGNKAKADARRGND